MIRELEHKLEASGTSLEKVLQGLCDFGAKAPEFYARIETIEQLVSELEGMPEYIQTMQENSNKLDKILLHLGLVK